MSYLKSAPAVIITGASQGLGFALSQRLLQDGFRVAICARHIKPLEHAVALLREYGEVYADAGDVSDPYFRSTFIEGTLAAFGRVDGIVNNASTLGDVPLPTVMDTNLANLRTVYETNVVAPVALLQLTIPHFTNQARAISLSISSDAAKGGYSNWGAYGSSKAALDLLTKTFASEITDEHIAFYSVDPGDMNTAMHEAAIPGDTGLAEPGDVADALAPLFRPLRTTVPWTFPSGTRLQVQPHGVVIIDERG